jgi:hypothetical protein
MRLSVHLAASGAALVLAASASAQSLGEVVGGAAEPVTEAAEPVTQAAAPVVESAAKAAQPVTQAAQPVTQAAQPVTNAVAPATDQVTGGSSSGGGSAAGGSAAAGSSSGASTGGSTAAPSSRTKYVIVNGKRRKPGEKQASGAGLASFGGAGGPGRGSTAILAATAAERSLHTALAKRQGEERAAKNRAAAGVLGARAGEDDSGVLSIPGIGDPGEFSFGTGLALLGVFALGFVGIVAGAASHVLARSALELARVEGGKESRAARAPGRSFKRGLPRPRRPGGPPRSGSSPRERRELPAPPSSPAPCPRCRR